MTVSISFEGMIMRHQYEILKTRLREKHPIERILVHTFRRQFSGLENMLSGKL